MYLQFKVCVTVLHNDLMIYHSLKYPYPPSEARCEYSASPASFINAFFFIINDEPMKIEELMARPNPM